MDEILKNFPFLTLGKYLNQEYIGIIGNSDAQIISMYIYSIIPTEEEKKQFLQLGEIYWWETNRTLPINVALRERWMPYRSYMKTFITKDFEIISGPCISLDDVMVKRVKRRQISILHNMP